ncbi:MAG: HYR domain-containing protein, partial [Capnocytophaga sp.]|nr:HYR domain-containing protein [Capnocytophaga sp.]
MNKFLLTIILLLTTLVAKSQDLNAFSIEVIQGECYSDSKLKITAPAGFPVTQLSVELEKPAVENGTPTPAEIQEFETSEYVFESLKPGVYTVTVINENNWVKSDPKPTTITSIYRSIEFLNIRTFSPSCRNLVDGRIEFTIAPNTGKGPDFSVYITTLDGATVLVPPQTFSRTNAAQAITVAISGNNTNPLNQNQRVLINVQDMTGSVANCEIRKEIANIPSINSDIDCLEIIKLGEASRIQTDANCKHRITFRIQRKDNGNIAPVVNYIQNNPAGIALIKRTKRDNAGNIISEDEYDITSSFRTGFDLVPEYFSFVTDYIFDEGDEIQITVNIGMTPIKERFILAGMNPTTHPPTTAYQVPIAMFNYSQFSCDPNGLLMFLAPYWYRKDFPNLDNPSAPASFHKYEWYQDLNTYLTEDQLYNQGMEGYYFELYKFVSGNWVRYTQNPIPSGHPLFMNHVSGQIVWDSPTKNLVDLTAAGEGLYKVIYRKTGTPACYTPSSERHINKITTSSLTNFFTGIDIARGVFENTVAFRKRVEPMVFNYPLTVTFKPSGVTIPAGGTYPVTFDTSLPFDNGTTHQRTVNFPVVKQVISAESVNNNIIFGDFPPGYYDVEVSDNCGNTVNRTINFDTPTVYGYNDVRVEYGCRTSAIRYNIGDELRIGSVGYATVVLYRKNTNGDWIYVPNPAVRFSQMAGIFQNLPAGEYKVRVYNMSYDRAKTIAASGVINPVASGALIGYTLTPEFSNYLAGGGREIDRGSSRQIFNEKEVIIREISPLQVDVIGTSCDASAGKGMVVVNILNQQDIRYPLTFTLYRESTTGTRNYVTQVVYDEASGAKSHIFTNLTDGKYHVAVNHLCATTDYETRVTANTYAKPIIRAVSETQNPCNGDIVRLTFSGSEVLFDIDWYVINTDGSRTHIGTGKTIRHTISSTTQFIADYKLKNLTSVCGTTEGSTSPLTVAFTSDTTPPIISGCPTSPIVVNAAIGKCSAIVTWGTVTATDACKWTHSQTHKSGDEFPIGTHTVTYTFTDTSGNTSTCTFNVIVRSNALDIDVDATYIDGTGSVLSGALALNQQFQYRIYYKNIGEENTTTSTLSITFSDNPYVTIGEPTLTYAAEGAFVPTYTQSGRTFTFVIPKETLRGNSERRIIYIPLQVNGDYEQIGKACMNFLATKYVMEYEGGNQNCQIPKQTKTATNTIEISTENNERMELFCAGSSLALTATDGFDSYRWYNNGTLINSATSRVYTATTAGTYTVEKIKNCNGTTFISKEIINFQEYNTSATDPIRTQANGGATCGSDGRWTSHFILCNETSRDIKVNFINTQLEWQRYYGTSTNSRCPDYGGDWRTDANGVDNTFTANTQGKYRLIATSSNGCQAYYYFDVYLNTLAGEIVQPVGHITNYQPGNFTVRMVTEGIPYQYTLRNSIGQIVNGINNATGSHEYRITGISDPGEYTIEVTSPNLANCSVIFKTQIQKQTQLTANATPRAWTDCNLLNIRFEAQGGLAPYSFAIWKIDDEQLYTNYTSIPASAFNIATIPAGQSFTEQQVNITRPGEYIFVTKDANGAYAETPKIAIYPEGVNGYTISTKDITCGFAPNSGQVSVTFNSSLQNIITELHRLDTNGNRVESYTPNASGFYDGLIASKYELEISIRKSGIKICQYINPLEIRSDENTLRAFAGVVEDESCDVNSPKRYKVHVNNVSGGSGTGYQYSSNGVNYGTSNVLYLNASGTVYVKDSNGCPLEIQVNITPLVPPTISVSNVEYTCSGKGTFTVTA